MYKIDKWLNCRALVPTKDLMILYKEFINYATSKSKTGMKQAMPEKVLEHNLSLDKEIPIPDELKEVYEGIGRCTPLFRARNLEKYLGTNCKIYFKREDILPTGSFKLNATLAQAYFAKKENLKRIITETAAGQAGAAAAFSASYFGLNCKIYMVKSSYESRRERRMQMERYGAEVISSPSKLTEVGRRILEENINNKNYPGNEAVAIAESSEELFRCDSACTLSGSFLDVVLTYQSVIGQEADMQLKEQFNENKPDKVIACVGGGSSFGGLVFPFISKYGNRNIEYFAVESEDIPKMTKGEYSYEYPSASDNYPKVKMYNLGSKFTPPDIHSTGLRYHGTSPILSYLVNKGTINAVAYSEMKALESASLFSRLEGIVPAPESSYCIAKVIDEAKKNDGKVILSIVSGNGFLDLKALEDYKNKESYKEKEICLI